MPIYLLCAVLVSYAWKGPSRSFVLESQNPQATCLTHNETELHEGKYAFMHF